MSSQGPLNAGNGTQTGVGISWLVPSGIVGGGSSNSNVSAGSTTKLLQGTAFGFSIPAGVIIQGISVNLRRSGDLTLVDSVATLLKSNAAVGNNEANFGGWDGSIFTYGGPSDLWGTTWSPSDINSSGFGFGISCNNTDVITHTATASSLSITVFFSSPFISIIQTG